MFFLVKKFPPAAFPVLLFIFFATTAPGEKQDTPVAASLELTEPGNYALDFPRFSRITPLSLTLENRGEQTLVGIYVYSRRDLGSIEAMVREICLAARNDREKAEALWRFMAKMVYNWHPARGDGELHDPVKLVNVYGYGFCDDAALSLSSLWKEAGFEARAWGIGGHVVAEVFYDNAWHMYDPDHYVFFENEDKTVASLEELEQNPEIVKNTRDPAGYDSKVMADLYASKENNRKFKGAARGHTMSFDLSPGEKWTSYKNNPIEYYSMQKKGKPKIFTNNVYHYNTRDIPLSPESPPGDNFENFSWLDRSKRILAIRDVSQKAVFSYRRNVPYVILKGAIHLECDLKDKTSRVRVFQKQKGKANILVGAFNGPGTVKKTMELKYVRGEYGYNITLECYAKERGDVSIREIDVRTTCQSSPFVFPHISSRNNVVTIRFEGESPCLFLSLEYLWKKGRPSSRVAFPAEFK